MFEVDIMQLFRFNDKGKFLPCVLLKSGKIFNDIYTPLEMAKEVEDKTIDLPDVNVEYPILQIYPDFEDGEKMYLLVEKD